MLEDGRMGGIGPEKIVLLFIVVLLLFGAKRLPEIGASLGKGIREFKGSLNEIGEPRTERQRGLRPEQPGASGLDVARRDDEARAEPKRLLT
jgi:sec-independent protein translocase protein TatA